MGFETGEHVGWGLAYRDNQQESSQQRWLYNDGVLQDDTWGSGARKYVGLDLSGLVDQVEPTNTYTPMPAAEAGRVILFDPAAGLGPPERAPDGDPLFMNIFLDPEVSSQKFSAIAACLSANQTGLNAALAAIPKEVPESGRQFVAALKLGGFADELPPYFDPAFREAVASMRSATTIPAYGDFLLYPGRSVTGRIDGHTVRLTAVKRGNDADTRFEVDGVEVIPREEKEDPAVNAAVVPNAPTNVPGVLLGDFGLTLDGPACAHQSDNCGERIDGRWSAGDQALSLTVSVRTTEPYYDGYESWPCWSPEARALQEAAARRVGYKATEGCETPSK
jgi:hypothetical protein